eukprot:4450478-Prymnesium_polylepis.1
MGTWTARSTGGRLRPAAAVDGAGFTPTRRMLVRPASGGRASRARRRARVTTVWRCQARGASTAYAYWRRNGPANRGAARGHDSVIRGRPSCTPRMVRTRGAMCSTTVPDGVRAQPAPAI